jgi:hypothetical protein
MPTLWSCRVGAEPLAGWLVQPVHLHADLKLKEQELARTIPPGGKPGTHKPSDQVLAFLEAL